MMYNPYSLDNKTILVTGASSGIGRSVAIECSKMGAKLIITGRNGERLNETFETLEGDDHIQIAADLTRHEDLERIVENCIKLDGFVSNAGMAKIVPVKHINKEILDTTFDTNTLAPILLTQLLVKKNKFNKPASIVFTSSLSGVYCVHYGESVYAASKGAIHGFAKGAALDLAAQQIRVNSVNPSIIQTHIFESAGVLSEAQLQEKIANYPLKRLGVPTDVAYAIIFYLSEASSWITGTTLVIDGGYTLI